MLQINNLTKKYKSDKKAVDNITLNVMPGDIFGFIGHNGAGKTTTIKCIVGIHDFDEGEILIDGLSVKEQPLKCFYSRCLTPNLIFIIIFKIDYCAIKQIWNEK